MKINKTKVLASIIAMTNAAMGMSIVAAETGATAGTVSNIPSQVVTAVSNILKGISTVGILVAAGMIIYAGFKFLTAGAGEKAKAKDMLVPLAVGAVLVAFAGPIATWAWGMVTTENGGVTL